MFRSKYLWIKIELNMDNGVAIKICAIQYLEVDYICDKLMTRYWHDISLKIEIKYYHMTNVNIAMFITNLFKTLAFIN